MTASVSPLKPRSTDKREEVLDIASENFLSKGFDGTSINVMAREAGISKESIYRYFGSKEDLFLAVVERELAVYRQGMLDTTRNYQGKTLRDARRFFRQRIVVYTRPDHSPGSGLLGADALAQ